MSALKFFEKIVNYFSSLAISLLGIAAVLLLFWIYKEEGLSGVWNTMTKDVATTFIRYISVLVVFFTITGALDHLQKRHQEEFHDVISGKRGTVKMVALAAALPGPAGGKQLQDAWIMKDSNKRKILMCLVGMMALNVNLILFRSKVLGGQLTLIWFGMALLLLLEVWVFFRFVLKI